MLHRKQHCFFGKGCAPAADSCSHDPTRLSSARPSQHFVLAALPPPSRPAQCMTAWITSPPKASWGRDTLSPPPDPALLDLDRSFGSSMSISSLDSPRRPRVFDDPFTRPPPMGPLEPLTMRTAPPKSSPHAMEISSPATVEGTTALFVHTAVRPPVLRRTNSGQRKSLSSLPSSAAGLAAEQQLQQQQQQLLHTPSSPPSPGTRPSKRRLASVKQLHDPTPRRCNLFTLAEPETRRRMHMRTQSVR